jgi:hypothetical protein
VHLGSNQSWTFEAFIQKKKQDSTRNDALKHPDPFSLDSGDAGSFELWLQALDAWPNDERIEFFADWSNLSVELTSCWAFRTLFQDYKPIPQRTSLGHNSLVVHHGNETISDRQQLNLLTRRTQVHSQKGSNLVRPKERRKDICRKPCEPTEDENKLERNDGKPLQCTFGSGKSSQVADLQI